MTASTFENRVSWPWVGLTATAPAIWGSTYIVTTHLLPPGHPVFAAFMRTFPAGVIAILWARKLPRGSWWWKSFVLGGLSMAAFFPLLFVSAERLPGGVAATVGAVQPLFVAVLAVVILRESVPAWRLTWGLVGVIGVALVVLGPDATLDPLGIVAGIAGALSMATGVVLTKKWAPPRTIPSIALAGWQLTAAGILLFVPALLLEGPPEAISTRGWLGYSWLALAGALMSYSVWFAGIRRLPVTSTALLGLLSPLVAATLGTLIAGESFGLVQWIGFCLALSAMVCGQLPQPHSKRKQKA
nr:EamA family transporter [Corynebacterium glaucum]